MVTKTLFSRLGNMAIPMGFQKGWLQTSIDFISVFRTGNSRTTDEQTQELPASWPRCPPTLT